MNYFPVMQNERNLTGHNNVRQYNEIKHDDKS